MINEVLNIHNYLSNNCDMLEPTEITINLKRVQEINKNILNHKKDLRR